MQSRKRKQQALNRFTQKDFELIESLTFLERLLHRDRLLLLNRKKHNSLGQDEIIQCWMNSWKVGRSKLLDKINHNNEADKIMKMSLFAGLYFYSSLNTSEIATVVNCRYSFITRSISRITLYMERYRVHTETLLHFFKSLDKLRPGRLTHLSQIDFSMINGVEDWKSISPLSNAEIEKIPLRTPDWFYNNNKSFYMLAYSINGEEVKRIKFSWTSDYILLHRLQCHGYRFKYFDAEEIERWNMILLDKIGDSLLRTQETMKQARKIREQNNEELLQLIESVKKPSPQFKILSYSEMVNAAYYSNDNDGLNIRANNALIMAKKKGDPSKYKFVIPIMPAKGPIRIIAA